MPRMLGACLRWLWPPAAILVLYAATIGGAVYWEKAASTYVEGVSELEPAPLSVGVRTNTTRAAVAVPSVPSDVEDDGGRLVAPGSEIDALYHPGVTVSMESIVVAAATGRVRELGGSLTEAEMDALLEHTGWPVEWRADAKAIAFCESKYRPGAIGDGGNSLGLWQTWTGWARPAGYEVDQLFDPEVNARVALYVRQVRGRFSGDGGWTCLAPSESGID